jgi:glycosyltransferase involved in cell wall biosynthesis
VNVERPQLAVVVQRYGADVTGGSESLARAVAERLVTDFRVTVFTTCARDYVTWRNEFPEGVEHLHGVEVERFAVEEERDLPSFNRLSDEIFARKASEEEELLWLRRQGPHAPGLVDALARRKDAFNAVVFFTYLYAPTYWGLKAAPDRSLLVPTAHDEPPLRLSIYESVFGAPRAFAFCSVPEGELVKARFALGERPTEVAGIGIEVPAAPDVEGFRIRHDVRGPYVLYAGRIDDGKGCGQMLDHYGQYRRDCRGAAQLLLIGKLAMPTPRVPGARYLGYLGEDEKRAAMAGARAVICPSRYESLSIVLLEALALGTPALVNARSAVLRDHAVRSRGALHYGNGDEFLEALDLLVREDRLRTVLGANGVRYVEENYRWDVVMAKYRALIEAVGPRTQSSSRRL